MYSVLLMSLLAAPADLPAKIAEQVPARGRAVAFRGGGVNVRVGGFSAFRGHHGAFRANVFHHRNAFVFRNFGFRHYGYNNFAFRSYYAPAAFAYSAPLAFSSSCGCNGGDGGTQAAVAELRAAIAELREALRYR